MDRVQIKRVSLKRKEPKADPTPKENLLSKVLQTGLQVDETNSEPKEAGHSLLTLSSFGLKSIAEEEDNKPIKGTYTDDLNILDIHRRILRILSPEGKRAITLQQKKQVLVNNVSKPQTVVDRKRNLASIEKLDKELTQLTSKRLLDSYVQETKQYLKIYAELGQEVKIRSIGKEQPKPNQRTELRLIVISRYLEIAARFVEIDIRRETPYNPYCVCGYNLADLEGEERAATFCPSCGLECNLVTQTVSSNGEKSGRTNYEDRENFFKALRRFQGKQNNKVPASVLEKLDNYFHGYDLPTSDIIRQRPLDSHGKREGTSLDMLLKALSEVGCSAYYEDVNLIGHLYWGWVLPDLGHLEESIMDDYDKSQRVFEQIKEERKSCLNTQYRLFRHLERQGFPCSKNDFKMVTTLEILEYHEDAWRTICSELGWDFHPMI